MINGGPQPRPQGQHLPLPIPQFMEVLKAMGYTSSYEQFLSIPLPRQMQLTQKVQEYVQRSLPTQGNTATNPQTVQIAYQQAQNFLQQAQRNAIGMQPQPGQAMTPEQRMLVQAKQPFLGQDPESFRQQLAQQGRMPPNAEVQAMFQQQLHARQQNPQLPQAPPPPQQHQQQQSAQQVQNLVQVRQIALAQQQAQQQQAQTIGLPNGQPPMIAQQQFRARQLQTQPRQFNAQNFNFQMTQVLNAMNPEQRSRFQSLDPSTQANLLQSLIAKQAPHQQQLQQQQQQQNGPQLQYNPLAAQNMAGAGRMPTQMVGMGQGQPTPNAVNGPAMMRQSTSGGNA